jgi:hypothetical protein
MRRKICFKITQPFIIKSTVHVLGAENSAPCWMIKHCLELNIADVTDTANMSSCRGLVPRFFLPARACKAPRAYILLCCCCCCYPRELAKLRGYTSCFVVAVACLLVLYFMTQVENLPLQQGSHARMHPGILPLQQGNNRRVHAVWEPATAAGQLQCCGAKLSGRRVGR